MNKKLFHLVMALGLVFSLLASLFSFQPVRAAGVLFASPTGVTSGTCSNWATACTLQYALSIAAPGDDIWVKKGVHKPTTVASNRDATFELKDGVGIYGGFNGNENFLFGRNWETNLTVLSGDIDNNDTINFFTGLVTSTGDIVGNNSYHVVSATSGVSFSSVLDGFYINAGLATGGSSTQQRGGGIYITNNSHPTLTNLYILANRASGSGGGLYNEQSSSNMTNIWFDSNKAAWGGGMYNYDNASPDIINASFVNNNAISGGGGMMVVESTPSLTSASFNNNSADSGGGMLTNANGHATLTNVIFNSNTAPYGGGGMYNVNSNPQITGGIFRNNSDTYSGGGGIFNSSSNPPLTNVVFHANSSVLGGAIYNIDSVPMLTNVTVAHNTAANAGGGLHNNNSHPYLINTIVWGNTAPANSQLNNVNSSLPAISYSDIQGCGGSSNWVAACGDDNGSNIDSDPLFANAGVFPPFLQLASPAIDAGDNAAPNLSGVTYDVNGNPRFVDVPTIPDTGNGIAPIVDMGAYEANNTKIHPEHGASSQPTTLTLSWHYVSDATEYEYCYSSAPGPCTKWYSVGNNNSVILSGLASGYTYYWQVRAITSSGIVDADNENWWSFTTTSTAICTWPAYTQPGASSFTDVQMDWATWNWIERLKNAGITQGCAPGVYCPLDVVSRQHMAIFLLRGKYCGSSYTPPPVNGDSGFLDVQPDWVTAPWIKQLAADEITQGCGNGNYCPMGAVSRQHMAIFLLRAKHGGTYSPPGLTGGGSGFADVDPTWATAPWIKQLAAENITQGCGNGNYCPLNPVSRQHMAIFLVRAFGLP